MKLEFLDIFSTNTQISEGMKIRPVGAELFHADGRTDMTKLIVALRNYADEPKKPRLSTWTLLNDYFMKPRYQVSGPTVNERGK